MIEKDFIPKQYEQEISQASFSWEAPSNIALVKYWGKKQNQIPTNPSLSFNLSNCKTTTSVQFQLKTEATEKVDFDLKFEGEEKLSFRPKIQNFLNRIETYLPFLNGYSLQIETSNSFPHSSGIASSASGMSALALCLTSFEKELKPKFSHKHRLNETEFFLKKASFLARLGSGSACRSIAGNMVIWGESIDIPEASNLFGIPYPGEIHEAFKTYQDTILLVEKGEKQVSSSVGHQLMNQHPFAASRFEQANKNLSRFKEICRSGNLIDFIAVVETEALSLHAMMITSNPYFLLLKPNTLAIIEKVFEFRKKTDLHLCFTLDAGANVHLLYPEEEKEKTLGFIKTELQVFCEDGHYICDTVGNGAKQLIISK